MVTNLAALRQEAFERLKRRGYEPFSSIDQRYIGLILYRHTQDTESLLFREAEEEICGARMGKWHWLASWLSYCHDAMSHPAAMADIALYLLGRATIPTEIAEALSSLKPSTPV